MIFMVYFVYVIIVAAVISLVYIVKNDVTEERRRQRENLIDILREK
jgi:hypothetical protein